MSEIKFNIYFCGMSDETFADKIMIYRPNSSISRAFSTEFLQQEGIVSVGAFIEYLKKDEGIQHGLAAWGLENFTVSTIYIEHEDCLLGLQEDKTFSDILDYFAVDQLKLAYFMVGGASIHNEKDYRFTIHPDEKIHKNLPHVHVWKAGVEIRYSLETFEPLDPMKNPHKRDNKKIIAFLKENQKRLLAMWRLYNSGYTLPIITEKGQQFYKES